MRTGGGGGEGGEWTVLSVQRNRAKRYRSEQASTTQHISVCQLQDVEIKTKKTQCNDIFYLDPNSHYQHNILNLDQYKHSIPPPPPSLPSMPSGSYAPTPTCGGPWRRGWRPCPARHHSPPPPPPPPHSHPHHQTAGSCQSKRPQTWMWWSVGVCVIIWYHVIVSGATNKI